MVNKKIAAYGEVKLGSISSPLTCPRTSQPTSGGWRSDAPPLCCQGWLSSLLQAPDRKVSLLLNSTQLTPLLSFLFLFLFPFPFLFSPSPSPSPLLLLSFSSPSSPQLRRLQLQGQLLSHSPSHRCHGGGEQRAGGNHLVRKPLDLMQPADASLHAMSRPQLGGHVRS